MMRHEAVVKHGDARGISEWEKFVSWGGIILLEKTS
jgi:hypothetical protein